MSQAFRDSEGLEWLIEITVATVKRVRLLTAGPYETAGVDLLTAIEGELVPRLMTDPVLLADVLYAVCAVQAEERGISDEDFGRRLRGESIDRAVKAFLEELADFFPSPQLRANLRKIIQATEATIEAAHALIAERIPAAAALAQANLAAQLSGDTSTRAPESAA